VRCSARAARTCFILGNFGLVRDIKPEGWLDIASSDGAICDHWAEHAASWWALRDRPNHQVWNFADLRRDAGPAVDEVAGLLGAELTDSQRATVLRRCSFEWMKEHTARFDPPPMPGVRVQDRSPMVRRGAAGGSDELLDGAQQAAIDRRCQARLKALGSDLPYAEWFGA